MNGLKSNLQLHSPLRTNTRRVVKIERQEASLHGWKSSSVGTHNHTLSGVLVSKPVDFQL